MRILLLGPNGQVGWELQRSLAPLGSIAALDRTVRQGLTGDLTRLDDLVQTVRHVQPDVIVNAAAYTAVDQAESEAEKARLINAEAPAVLAREARACRALLIHYSTDYVFDGSGSKPWSESDVPAPLNIYGSTKLAGERAIADSGCRHVIFRTSWVYAVRGKNFIHTVLRLASERSALQIVNDQYGAPTGAELIADITAHAIRRAKVDPAVKGVLHLTARGGTSWHDYARYVIECARGLGWPLRVKDVDVKGVSTEEFPTPAPRPRNSQLNCYRLEGLLDVQLPSWQAGVERTLTEIPLSD